MPTYSPLQATRLCTYYKLMNSFYVLQMYNVLELYPMEGED